MTREECIGLLERYAEYHGMGIPNLAGCREAMKMAVELLSQPSLPSDLDEAAFNYAEACQYDGAEKLLCVEHFKAGAEWMAGRGVSMVITDETEWADVDKFVHSNCDGASVIQIRKKQ